MDRDHKAMDGIHNSEMTSSDPSSFQGIPCAPVFLPPRERADSCASRDTPTEETRPSSPRTALAPQDDSLGIPSHLTTSSLRHTLHMLQQSTALKMRHGFRVNYSCLESTTARPEGTSSNKTWPRSELGVLPFGDDQTAEIFRTVVTNSLQ